MSISRKFAPRPCPHCGNEFQPTKEPRIERGLKFDVEFCNRCEDYLERKPKEDCRPESRLKAWSIPFTYRKTNRDWLFQDKLAAAEAWEFGPIGMLFAGVPRSTKTRTMFEAAKWQVAAGREVLYVSASFLHTVLAEALTISAGRYREKIEKFQRAKILFIDDLGKKEFSKFFGAALFEIVSYRCDHEKPIFTTTNYSPRELIQRFVEVKTGEPTVERLVEYCNPLIFRERSPYFPNNREIAA